MSTDEQNTEKEPWWMEPSPWRTDPTIPQPKFTFYQEVIVNENAEKKNRVGLIGAVLGIGDDEGNGYSYQVSFWCHGKELSLGFMENELTATGRFFKRTDYYPEEDIIIHVSMDGEIIPDYISLCCLIFE